ncbi:hypothetical protein [Collimonas sp.]|jgi:hypothetical protein|uniref:hypothetical protein n=1 Tax=Collimonas sp. TaxID=1963772 RepID=UPI0037C0F2E3
MLGSVKKSAVTTILYAAMALTASAASVQPAPPWQRVHLTHDSIAYDFPVYANHPLDGDLSKIEQIVVIQHGILRNGAAYYAAGLSFLNDSGIDPDQVLLLAPNFPAKADLVKGFERMPLWYAGGEHNWADGDDSVNPPYRISSLQVLDDLLQKLTDKDSLPRLRRVTLAGHSAGAQMMQRYAALNNIDEGLRSRGIALRYVIANPSSYLYFTPERPQGAGFAPYDSVQCAAYNQYRYGMQNVVPYGQGRSGMALFQRYAQRQITYLLGANDNDPNHSNLDKRCGAEAQGPSRLQRGLAYQRYERHLAGAALPLVRSEYEVIGVGHDQAGMFGSQCGRAALFGNDGPGTGLGSGAVCRPAPGGG